METTKSTITDIQHEFRKKISEMLLREPFFVQLNSADISEALVRSAYAWRDYNGGIDDTCHTAKCLHDIVDKVAEEQNPKYNPEQLQKYLRKTKQI